MVRLNEVTHSVFYAPQYVALSQGFFAEEGLQVELINGGGADKVMTAVVSGQSDIGLAGPEASIYVYNQGKADHTQIIAQLTKRDGSFLVGRSDGAFSWEDLRGKTIIGGRKGGVPEMTLEYVLRQNGLTPGVDVTVDTSVQFNMMAGAFTGGQGDYVTLFEPTATQVEKAAQGYVLVSIGQESGEIPYTAYFANVSWLRENADTAQRFVNAIAKAQKWVQEHTDREVAEAIVDQFPDTSLEFFTFERKADAAFGPTMLEMIFVSSASSSSLPAMMSLTRFQALRSGVLSMPVSSPSLELGLRSSQMRFSWMKSMTLLSTPAFLAHSSHSSTDGRKFTMLNLDTRAGSMSVSW